MNEAEGVAVYWCESGEDLFPAATSWQIDAEYNLTVKSGPTKVVAFYRERGYDTVRNLGFERTTE